MKAKSFPLFSRVCLGIFLLLWCVAPSSSQSLQPWEGQWTGYLKILTPGEKDDSIKIDFTFRPLKADSVWEFNTLYHSQIAIGSDYQLLRTGPQEFILDEKNSIKIPMYLMGKTLFGSYIVAGKLFNSRFELIGNSLLYEITILEIEKGTATGGKGAPAVKNIPLFQRQYGLLFKKE